jgi:TonB family protein
VKLRHDGAASGPLAQAGSQARPGPRAPAKPQRLSAFAISLAGALFAARSAIADPPPPGDGKNDTPPSDANISVPRGPGGAIIKPAAPQEEAPKGQQTMPRPLNYVPPDYPPEAEKAGLEATVTLQIDVSKDGKVLNISVVDPAGHGFDESAIAAGKKLVFEPAHRADGTPFAARFLYRYSFTLKKGPAAPGPGEEPGPAAAPKQSLKGLVVTAEGDVPITGAHVSIAGDGGSRSEADVGEKGAFTFGDVPAGSVRVTISAPGYDTLIVEETLKPSESIEVKYRLAPQGGALEVTIRGERPPREVVKRTLEQREISRIPGTNGDALRSIQSLPGVARPPGLAGLLIVRGSAPQDTQTFIDGTPVPLIYHFGGLSSVVPTELLDKIDFYPGNFSSQYGRVQGGIVDAALRPTKDDGKYHGLAQIDLIDFRAILEGPIPFLKGWNFIAAGRRSYVDAWLGPVLKSAGAGVTQAPVYYDYQFMVEKTISPTSRFRAAFFGSDDALRILLDKPAPGEPALAGNIGLHTAFKRLQLKYSNDLGDGDRVNAVLALGQDNIDFGLSAFYFLLDIKSLTGRVELSKRLWKGAILNTGLDMFSGSYTVNFRGPAAPAPGQPPNQPFSTRQIREQNLTGAAFIPAVYAELELSPAPRLKLVPGVRVDYTNYTNQWDVSPRVNGRFDIHPEYPRTTAKAGVGFFHQPPQFQESLPPLGTPNLKSNRALHYALGLEQELSRHIEASVEGFYKQLDSLVIGAASPSGASLEYTNTGKGYVVGSEVLIKYKPDDRFFGWIAYTLSRSARVDSPGDPEHLFNFDQTHILTVLGSYRLGHGWEFGARFRLISGNLITPNVCDNMSSSCDPARTGGLFHAPSGVYIPIPVTGPYSERLPLFHQLDLRVDKRWKFKSWELSAYLDVQNVYNHANVEGLQYNFNYTARQYVTGLPILPSIGLRGEF